MQTVVLGFYGSTLDHHGRSPKRWQRWRPTLSLVGHEDLVVDRLELLVADHTDASVLLEDVRQVSPETEVRTHAFNVEDPWDFGAVYAALYDFATAFTFEDDVRYLVHLTTGTHVAQICLFLLTETGFIPGGLIQSAPPRRGQRDPTYAIVDLDLSKYDAIAQRFEAARSARTRELRLGIETRNRRFNALIDELERVVRRSDAPILLGGPTGVGKTQLARRIHALKVELGRAGDFVEVNCATLRGDQAMSTLFGHRRGSFTGADRDRVGLLERADGGVLFLDEIGELGLDEQAVLLTAIEDKRFVPFGDETARSSDFQLIAGTNRDLREDVRAGRFRDDLLARIDLWHFELPTLAERREDIGPNIDFELARQADRGRNVRFRPDARKALLAFATSAEATWQNNFRDLSACVARLSTLADRAIELSDVEDEIERLNARWGDPARAPELAELELDEFDRVQLEHVIAVCRRSPSIAAAGRALFAVSRAKKARPNDADRLRKYLARFGIEASSLVGA